MASNVKDIISAQELGGGLIPTQFATEIIQNAPQSSVVLSRATRVPMSTRTRTQPVLDTLPMAYWVGGDTGLKQTTKQNWKGLTITAEELAAIVPIPEAVIADSAIPLWPEIMPRLSAAIGLALDQAALFGVNKPSSFPTAVVPAAISAGNVVAEGTGTDLAVDVASLGQKLAKQGFAGNGFASSPGLTWKLIGLRNANGTPIFVPSLAESTPATLYGYPLNEVTNGAWNADVAELLLADWLKFVVGVRQDISYKLLDQSVISDDDGKIILNLAQQDSVALRVTFRVGFQVANPLTELEKADAKRYPAGVITPKAVAPAVGGVGK